MKNNRFIELLNLCVDNQLTPAEATELDAALYESPERRRTYQQYCRMQKACAALSENERAQAPASPALAHALAAANRKIEAPRDNHRPLFTWARGLGVTACLAAAACLVFVLAHTAPTPSTPNVATNSAQPALAKPGAQQLPANEPTSPTATVANAPASKHFRFPAINSFAGDKAPVITDENIVAWAKDIQLRPIRKISAEDIAASLARLDKSETPAATLTPATSGTSHVENSEMTALQFQR